MKAIRKFTVRSVLPPELSAVGELVANLRWSWHEPTRKLLAHISPDDWEATTGDPIALLGAVSPDRLAQLAADEGFVAWANSLRDDLNRYLSEPRWYQALDEPKPTSIGYFSPEFGIAAALPQYSGGLGILAGDHLKAASDLGVPIVGVGLFYRAGYFRQAISRDGWQQESYPVLDPDGLPLSVLRLADGAPAQVVLALPDDRALYARIWQAQVGRVKLLLLDTDIPDNDDDLRSVTDRLYGGGGEHRLLQELLLGIGGKRALKIYSELTDSPEPEVYHTNEGHAGFQGLERICDLIGEGLSFDVALQVVRAGTVFTTHTPVPAGIDRFEAALVERYFSTDLLPGVDVQQVLALGNEVANGGAPGMFNMAVMGLRLAQRANGVSQLHGEVSRGMFAGLWPGFDQSEVPITSVTNGVHAPTWTDPLLIELAQNKLGTSETATANWASPDVSDDDLWAVRNDMRRQLVFDARHRVTEAWLEQSPGSIPPAWYRTLLDPAVLTIGFARRVPTYKRLTLMLHDPARLKSILLNPTQPVQLVIAGKSHPADEEGKRLIQKLVQFASDPEVRHRIVFLPNYDIGMAQKLYPGTDVWLNNPLRPLEACGTSGMKAALNGGLNLSILDGWWNEYYDGENGWAIPTADSVDTPEERDQLESEALYDLIEHQVAPRFYDRNAQGLPERWTKSIRHTLSTLSPQLSAERMVSEYALRLYLPAAAAATAVIDHDYGPATALAEWKEQERAAWPSVAVVHVESGGLDDTPQVGDELQVRARVNLGSLTPSDVSVQVVYGHTTNGDQLADVRTVSLAPAVLSTATTPITVVTPEGGAPESDSEGLYGFSGTVVLGRAGSFGYTVRVVPRHENLASSAELGLVATAR
ncbi:alpha-glucan family phosphorylase [Subtercola boreus]|uniref:glycogen phosphorylase n=1 Tax=Subtercola boreus TaxID=120213 RepID=A0A3E0WDW2_9MICO|nr:alpha-glucan family phosphorylase [Subtercola boreus]RFA22047.1 glycogen phosphorylase [Subtercola boreus]RFA22227.1 glycogen phosphorylase [Subtercola boreus]RFA28090.1 glycogen phosphorylase [Subtercola boreus]